MMKVLKYLPFYCETCIVMPWIPTVEWLEMVWAVLLKKQIILNWTGWQMITCGSDGLYVLSLYAVLHIDI
jgi:hypothetical protein